MTEEQRRQAAAQRCRELYEAKFGDVTALFIDPNSNAWVDTVLQLDELARKVRDRGTSPEIYAMILPHILPQPKPSPVERLAGSMTAFTSDIDPKTIENLLDFLGLKLVEVDPSDDQ